METAEIKDRVIRWIGRSGVAGQPVRVRDALRGMAISEEQAGELATWLTRTGIGRADKTRGLTLVGVSSSDADAMLRSFRRLEREALAGPWDLRCAHDLAALDQLVLEVEAAPTARARLRSALWAHVELIRFVAPDRVDEAHNHALRLVVAGAGSEQGCAALAASWGAALAALERTDRRRCQEAVDDAWETWAAERAAHHEPADVLLGEPVTAREARRHGNRRLVAIVPTADALGGAAPMLASDLADCPASRAVVLPAALFAQLPGVDGVLVEDVLALAGTPLLVTLARGTIPPDPGGVAALYRAAAAAATSLTNWWAEPNRAAATSAVELMLNMTGRPGVAVWGELTADRSSGELTTGSWMRAHVEWGGLADLPPHGRLDCVIGRASLRASMRRR
jgi:hypothetical protein